MAFIHMETTGQKGISIKSNDFSSLKKPSKDRTELDRDDFMKLFVTQLQYQDPMNPMESAEMASQVAQFNMVDLLYKNNTAMEKLVSAAKAHGLSEAVAFMGKDITYKGRGIEVSVDGIPSVEFEPSEPTTSTLVVIRDDIGRVIRTQELGALEAERKEFLWDGLDDSGEEVPPDLYTIDVKATDGSGGNVSVVTWTTGTVVGLKANQDGDIVLSLDTGETTKLSDIEKVGR